VTRLLQQATGAAARPPFEGGKAAALAPSSRHTGVEAGDTIRIDEDANPVMSPFPRGVVSTFLPRKD
jgi:hypothetical protein